MDDRVRTEIEAAAFRRLVEHLRERNDVQNIDLMNLSGFCRNCLSKWYQAAAEKRGAPLTKAEARETVYGMPYDEWKARYQVDAGPDQLAKFRTRKQAKAKQLEDVETGAAALKAEFETGGFEVWRVSAFAMGAGRTLWLRNAAMVNVEPRGGLWVQGPDDDAVKAVVEFLESAGWL